MIFKNHTQLSTACLHYFVCNFKVIIILIAFLVFTACSSSGQRAPVYNRTQPPSTKVTRHVVAPGETLYSIAWRYGLDYKGLARANRIGSSYRIFPGQIIYLNDQIRSRSLPKTSVAVTPSPPSPALAPKTKKYKPVQKKIESPPRVIRNSNKPAAKPRSEKKSTKVVDTPPIQVNNGKIFWRWPAAGRVLTNFSRKGGLKKGIDIEGKKGESVTAAASGEVVYAGSGLRGYGKLVIIKHSDIYLSAYAHNQRLRVKEGDIVKAGQRIADIGSSGIGTKGKPRLHFQIRRDGKPINPLPLLPKRKT